MHEQIFNTIQENFRTALSIYFDWYTFFWTLNLAALAWIYAKDSDLPDPVRKNRRAIAIMFFLLSGLGACSSLVMIPFTSEMNAKAERARSLWAAQTAGFDDSDGALAGLAEVPSFLTQYAFLANAASTLLIGVFWMLMFLRDKQAGTETFASRAS